MSQCRHVHPLATEVKYLVDAATAQRIRDWARAHLGPDPNGGGPFADGYHITSLYFDTAQLDVFHRRGSFGRAKYRIRRYGNEETVFLERKMKTRDYLHKRRTAVPIGLLPRLGTADDQAQGWEGDWFRRRIAARKLRPVCEIAYQRTARIATAENGPTRLTVDEAVQARQADDLRFSMAPGVLTFGAQCVVEMKYVTAPPALMKRFLEQFKLTPKPVSKYRASVEALGLAGALHA